MSEQESAAGGGGKFDPSRHMRQLRGRGGNSDYLDVKWRLVWLRSEHPDAHINTEHVTITADLAIFRAQVTIPEGGSATGYGSETARDFGDFIEKAETKALGRALIALGYGTQFAQEFGEDEVTETVPVRSAPSRAEAPAAPRPTPAPAPQPATPQRAAPPPPTQPRAEVIPADTRRPTPVRPLRELDDDSLDAALPLMAEERPAERPAPARIRAAAPPPAPEPELEPELEPIARAIPRPAPAPQPVVRPAPRPTPVVTREPDLDTLEEEGVDMANYGWTEFWSWARARGYSDRKSLDAVVGRPTSGMTPMEIRKSIQAKGM
jgi:hypothetical protein